MTNAVKIMSESEFYAMVKRAKTARWDVWHRGEYKGVWVAENRKEVKKLCRERHLLGVIIKKHR